MPKLGEARQAGMSGIMPMALASEMVAHLEPSLRHQESFRRFQARLREVSSLKDILELAIEIIDEPLEDDDEVTACIKHDGK